ncbi:putative leader peptide [Streptomyces sp. NPDC055099]
MPLLPPVPPLTSVPLLASVSLPAPVPGPRVLVIAPSRQVHLYSRHHIDLQRVAGALCRS